MILTIPVSAAVRASQNEKRAVLSTRTDLRYTPGYHLHGQ